MQNTLKFITKKKQNKAPKYLCEEIMYNMWMTVNRAELEYKGSRQL